MNALNDFLKNISDEDANEISKWLDGNPGAVDSMIETIMDSHDLQEVFKNGTKDYSKF